MKELTVISVTMEMQVVVDDVTKGEESERPDQ